ncbi:MAG: hypothetical protein R3E53_00765 [Myxococcota bacterium]
MRGEAIDRKGRVGGRPGGVAGAAGILVLAGLVLLALDCERARRLDYHLASAPIEEGRADPDRAAFERGSDAPPTTDVFEPIAGGRLSLLRTERPVLSLRLLDTRAIELREAIPRPTLASIGGKADAAAGAPSGAWHAELVLQPAAVERLRRLREAHPDLHLLVREANRAIDYVPLASMRTDALPGGTFASLEAAQDFYAGGEGSRWSPARAARLIVVEPLSDAERAFWSERNRRLVEYALWLRACEPERLDEVGQGLVEALDEDPDRVAGQTTIDCAAPTPDVLDGVTWDGPGSLP